MNKLEPSFEHRGDSIEQPRPDTWAASPIDLYGSDDIKRQQQKVFDILVQRAVSAGEELNLDEGLRDVIITSTMQRFHYESDVNYTNYQNRQNTVPDFDNLPEGFIESYERALSGNATPYELIRVREALGMRSIELGKLSHIGGIDIDKLGDMRTSVCEAILSSGGELFSPEDSNVSYSIISNDAILRSSPNKPQIEALTMNRTRYIGTLADDTVVKEKSQFILRSDELCGLDEDIASAIREIQMEDGRSWRDKILSIDGFSEAVTEVLSKDHHDIAIPLVTTIYAHKKSDKEIAEDLKKLEDSTKERRENIGKKATHLTGRVLFMRKTDGTVPPIAAH